MSTIARLRYLIIQTLFLSPVLALAAAGVFLNDQIARSPILWGLGGFVGAITGLLVLWVIQPMIDRHSN